VFLFQRARPMLSEYEATGQFLRSIGEGLFTHPHGLRIDQDDNVWTTDAGVGPERTLYVADGLNWRFQVFKPVAPTGKLSTYVPTKRMFWDREPSTGWSTRTAVPKN
jgi:hypothetical protein